MVTCGNSQYFLEIRIFSMILIGNSMVTFGNPQFAQESFDAEPGNRTKMSTKSLCKDFKKIVEI